MRIALTNYEVSQTITVVYATETVSVVKKGFLVETKVYKFTGPIYIGPAC